MIETSESRSACLEVHAVGKRFGSTVALDDVSLTVVRGQVHALLGHNGSGKSTLVKIISGYLGADSGTVTINAASGSAAMMGIVHQDLALALDATVLENCCMSGYRTTRWGFIDWAAARRGVEPVLERLSAEFGPDDMVGDLSPANQAIVAIARALVDRSPGGEPERGPDLLILDEATARLRGPDADKVLATARRVAEQGGGVLLVTHHMAEVLDSADWATVLANGRVSGAVQVARTSEEELLEMVSGRKMSAQTASATVDRGQAAPELIVAGLTGDAVTDIDLSVGAGEVVGLTGAAGAGFEEIPYLLAGSTASVRGRITVGGKDVKGSVSRRRRLGLSLVPADRLRYGLLASASNRENLSPQVRRPHIRRGLSNQSRERRWASEVCTRFNVMPADAEAPTGSLSGGNQQKVLLARALEDRPRVLILHEPTQGVDEGTRRSLVELIRQAAAAGTAVLYVSSDIEEVAACADRVLVFRRGMIVKNMPGGFGQVDNIYASSYFGRSAGVSGTRQFATVPGPSDS